ncbi:TetR/AcrR family transcriptional regulator [Arthrobacter bambusae]|uniref:TetR/AcrR family transcriptional regulator n=1 Tax=Arthrobacter bambusae TaxID=1338426 RepID=UPI0027894100|nr:TetR/AcrR family transcriptional regulator [Arthrobacter bambusae]MDQ0028432.1 AcrR family transcriptional regulator [Arthrobacter bambusae]MDQ0096773.1 AcrR family transcriptional regulator [Arthrobacter bambusae]
MEERGVVGSARGSAGTEMRKLRGRPREGRVDAAVLAAAAELLGEAGFARLTMELVAARAGVSKASLYLRWPNKTALVADAIGFRARPVPELPDTGSLPADMRKFLADLARNRGVASKAVSALSGEIASNPDLRKAWRARVSGELEGSVRRLVQRAVDRGELPSSTDVDLLAMLPLALLQFHRLEGDAAPGSDFFERIVTQFYTPRPGSDPAGGQPPSGSGA